MSHHLFTLDQKRPTRRFICPACGKRTFKRYQDNSTGELFQSDNVGRCNREINCGYHYPPKQFFIDHPTSDSRQGIYRQCLVSNIKPREATLFSTIPVSAYEGSLREYNNNHFVVFLKQLFGTKLTQRLLHQFSIGTAKTWPGATVFWQIDELGNIRAGKIMLYNAETGKRVKEPYNHVQWVHSVMNLPAFHLHQCLFGVHQIPGCSHDNPVCIVESEKTAILMTAILPDFIWLATGGLNNLNSEKCTAFKTRKIYLFPDLGCFARWSQKAEGMKKAGLNILVSDLLERFASEKDRSEGYDLADYFIRLDPKCNLALTEENYPLFWDH